MLLPPTQQLQSRRQHDINELVSLMLPGLPVQLADHQREALVALDQYFLMQRGARGILSLPTAAGKTLIALVFLLTRYIASGQRGMWIAHRVDLLDQVEEVIHLLVREFAGDPRNIRVSRYQGDHDLTGDIILASAQTLASRRPSLAQVKRAGPLGLIVFDEAHRTVAPKWWKALDRLVRSRRVDLLGLTATPFRSSDAGTARLQQVYGEEPVYQRSFRELIGEGFLARPVFVRQQIHSTRGFQVTEDEIRQAKRLGDLPPAVLGRLARDDGRTQEICAHWMGNRGSYGKTLVFACNIDHAEALSAAFRQRGVAATSLHSKLPPDDRVRRLQGFRDGEYELLVNVAICTEGVDVPDIKTVLMARPTLSEVLYVQMIGRGTRGPMTVPGKTHFYVIDTVDNFDQHGLRLATGHDVVEDLGDTLRAPRTARPRTQEAAIISNLAWMHLRGFAAQQYTLWGELRWTKPDGIDKSMAVFSETLQAMETALEMVQAGITSGQWHQAEQQATELDDIGAVRTADWNEMVGDVRETGVVPELIAIEAAEPGVEKEQEDLAADLVEMVKDLMHVKMIEVSGTCKKEWENGAKWHALYPNWEALFQQVMNLMPVVYEQEVAERSRRAAATG